MLKKYDSWTETIEGIAVTIQPFGFENSCLIQDSVNINENTLELKHCFTATVNSHTLIRTAKLDSKEKIEQYCQLLGHLFPGQEIYVSSTQLHSVEYEWGAVEMHHEYLWQCPEKIIHISSPINPIYSDTPPRDKTARERRDLVKLPQLLNAEAWIDYCALFNQDVEKTIRALSYDAVDTYTLERYLKEFTHEVKSTLLPPMRKRIFEIQEKIGIQETRTDMSYLTLVALQKELILAREDLLRQVHAHLDTLVYIIENIKSVEEAHPELIDFKNKALILSQLLTEDDWNKQQMLIQLFNDRYGLISTIHSEDGMERANIAFSIRLAIVQLQQQFSLSDILRMLQNWEELNREANAGRTGNNILIKLRDLFLQNLLKFSIPITAQCRKDEFRWHEGLHLNKIFLHFLPSHAEMLNENDEMEYLPLVHYDVHTKEPTALTQAGHRLMSQIKGSV